MAAAVGCFLVARGVRRRSLYLRIRALKDQTDAATWERIQESFNVVERAFAQYRDSELALAFNGGKDCLIVFQLVKAYCEHYHRPMPFLVYFEREDEFPEMIDFMHRTVESRNLTIHTVKGGFKQGLQELKDLGIRAVLMGQRRSDPYAPDAHFAMTTQGWPELMRINPILDMNYTSVWAFLRGTSTTYCSLYDQGYTSLGPKSKTLPHSRLSSDSVGSTARPAHELVLEVEADERAGRV